MTSTLLPARPGKIEEVETCARKCQEERSEDEWRISRGQFLWN